MKLISVALISFSLFIGACHKNDETSMREIIIGLSDPPTTLDPRSATDANSIRICDLIFSSLVSMGNDLKPRPDAALSWTRSPKKMIFKVRRDLHFHDGSSVTLQDIVASFMEYMKPTSPFSSNLQSVRKVSGEDPDKLIFDFNEEDASFLIHLVELKILPQKALSQRDFGRNPLGSGPFAFSSWDNEELKIIRKEKGPSSVSKMTFKFVRDENTRYLKMVKGDLDVLINELQEEKVAEIMKTGRASVLITPGLNFNYLLLNLKDPRLNKVEIRRALFSAIQRVPIIKYKLSDMATLAGSLLAPINPFSVYDLDFREIPLNEAKKIMDGASLKGAEFSFKTSDQAVGNGQIIAEQFEKNLGIKINLQSFEWATYYSDVKAGRYQIALMRWVGIVDPDVYRDTLSSKEFPPGHNRGFYNNSDLDHAVDAARRQMNLSERKALYTKAQRIVAQDLPILPLWYNANISIISPRIKNFEPATTGSFLPLALASKE